LGSTAVSSAQATVLKEPTNLVFVGGNPYLAQLTDANGTPMRERFVYFTFSNAGATVTATRAAETDANGIAQLRGMTVPAGSYTASVSFPGTIPTSAGTVTLNNLFYLPSQAHLAVSADVTAPTCTLTNVNYSASGVATSVSITVRDAGSGMSSLTPTVLTNATFSAAAFSVGQTSPLVVNVKATDVTQSTSVVLHAVDVAGNAADCDAELIQVGKTTTLPHREHASVPETDSSATIYNGTPGVQKLQIKVDQAPTSVQNLQPGEIRTVDLPNLAADRAVNNDVLVTVTAQGKSGGNAFLIFSDVSTGAP
jgi:hypothetical protein